MGYMRGGQQAEPMLQLDEVGPEHQEHIHSSGLNTLCLLLVVPDVPVL